MRQGVARERTDETEGNEKTSKQAFLCTVTAYTRETGRSSIFHSPEHLCLGEFRCMRCGRTERRYEEESIQRGLVSEYQRRRESAPQHTSVIPKQPIVGEWREATVTYTSHCKRVMTS